MAPFIFKGACIAVGALVLSACATTQGDAATAGSLSADYSPAAAKASKDDPDALVCRYVKITGYQRRRQVCVTRTELEELRERARLQIEDDNLRNDGGILGDPLG